MSTRHAVWIAALLAAVLASLGMCVAARQAGDDASTPVLQQQVDALSAQLDQIERAPAPTARHQALQRHWSSMQVYLRSLRAQPGMQVDDCMDWMLLDPRMAAPKTMTGEDTSVEPTVAIDCPLMEHGVLGDTVSDWALPGGIGPGAYRQTMQPRMQAMRAQVAEIDAERDPAQRQVLLREHYRALYRDLQTLRGLGWMWNRSAAASLPERDAAGADRLVHYCSQCHAPPSPSLHTASEWEGVTGRMRVHIADEGARVSSDIRVPSYAELNTIDAYLRTHARRP